MSQTQRKLNGSQWLAILLVAGMVGYLLIASLLGGEANEEEKIALTTNRDVSGLVKTKTMQAQNKPLNVVLYGSTEANRLVKLRAQTEGQVESIGVEEGSFVKQGDIILTLDPRDRNARVDQAKAQLAQAKAEYDAGKALVEQGAQSRVAFQQSKARYEEAKANLEAARETIQNTQIIAPFDGVVETIGVEVGDLVGRGMVVNGDDSVATVVEFDPLIVSGQVPQQKRGELQRDKPATVRLISGREVEGSIRYVGTVTDPNTRTFRVEVTIPNPENTIPVGVSAELFLPTGSEMAYHVSPSVLSLDADGNIGVKLVKEDGTVGFHEVDLLEDSAEGIWIAGLPDEITLITLGHNFVSPGQSLPQTASTVPAEAETQASAR